MKGLTIQKTDDYSQFKHLKGNRELIQSHVNKLAKQIEKIGAFTEMSPLLVSGEGALIDGQHRLAAHIKHFENTGVKIPVFYIVRDGFGIKEACNLNSYSKSWNPKNYAVAFAATGNSNYAAFLKYQEKTGLDNETLMLFLSQNKRKSQDFKDEKFVVANESQSALWLEQLCDIKEFIKEFMSEEFNLNGRRINRALLPIISSPNYDHKRMMSQMEKFCRILHAAEPTAKGFALAFQRLFNKNQKKIKLLE